MKNLILSLPLALFAAFALTSSGAGTAQAVEQLGACEEFVTSAPAPEQLCGKCGDGFCSTTCGESAKNCPQDCGVSF